MITQNIRITILILLSLIPLTCLYSCSDDLPANDYDGDTTDGVEISVPLSLSVAPLQSEDPQTRATEYLEATDDEKKITDFWIIEYNEHGIRVGLPRYFEVEGEAHTSYTLDNINIIVPREEGQNYTCVLIANTRDSSMFGKHNRAKFSTLDALRNFDKDVTNQEDLFKPAEGRYLLMSGWIHITKDTRKLDFDLVRNVSKVKVKLTKFPDKKLELKYFQWCDVPFCKLFPHGTNANYKQKVSRNWRQHDDFDTLRSINGYDYYIPCNSWIPEDISVAADNGTTLRVEDPTYFDIVCHLNNENEEFQEGAPIDKHALYKFSIYPSKDKKKQFNFKPNHYYEIEVSVNDIPDPETDPFFNEVGYTYLRGANCYIVDPNSKDIFKLYLDQINKFWKQYNNGKDLLDEDPNNKNNEWVAEVIWQDTDVRIFDFSFAEDEDSEKDLTKFDGHGNSYFTFCPSHSGTGNVIVGVRKRVPENEIPARDKREYFWSWHIWITDYKPDEHPDKWITSYNEWLSDKYVYPVTGGEVHTYLSHIWEATDNNIIKHRFMMDRNLGAWSANPDDGYRTFGFYYQRGRKDPFPIANSEIQKVYDIDGNEIDVFNVGSTNMIIVNKQATIADGVKYPYKLFEYKDSPDWYDDVKYDQFDRGWLNYNVEHYTEKSIFDPCPPGWMLPPPEAYAIGQDGTFGPKSGGKIIKNNLGIDLGIDFNFYPSSPQTIWFPFNSIRGTGPKTGYYWTAPTNGSCVFNFADPTVGASFTTILNVAGVRCISAPPKKD